MCLVCYLTGYVSGQHFQLTTFDGSHVFLFTGGAINDDYLKGKPVTSMEGDFYSGNSRHETFTAVRDPNARLPGARKSGDGTPLKKQ